MKEEIKSFEIAKVNDVNIVVVKNGEDRVAIKPLCDAIGISLQAQREKIISHPIYSSVVKIILTTGADGKQYEMVTLPAEYIFGWIMSIDSRKVKPEAEESVRMFQVECHRVLFYHFVLKPQEEKQFIDYKNKLMQDGFEEMQRGKLLKSEGTGIEKTGREIFMRGLNLTLDEYKAQKNQLMIPFPEVTTPNVNTPNTLKGANVSDVESEKMEG